MEIREGCVVDFLKETPPFLHQNSIGLVCM